MDQTLFHLRVIRHPTVGMKKPPQCPAFGTQCNPQNPLGAPMVSAEGACAAYYRYHRVEVNT